MKNKIVMLLGEAQFDSTLLIPGKLKVFFDEKVDEFGGIGKLFQFVVNSKHSAYNDRPRAGTGRTTYTPEGLNLHRVNFKPRNEDWERFRIIANSQRISMCLLFVMILLFWDEFETNVSRVPVTTGKISLLITQITGPAFTIIHLCRHRI